MEILPKVWNGAKFDTRSRIETFIFLEDRTLAYLHELINHGKYVNPDDIRMCENKIFTYKEILRQREADPEFFQWQQHGIDLLKKLG
jgi:hypothetical protein